MSGLFADTSNTARLRADGDEDRSRCYAMPQSRKKKANGEWPMVKRTRLSVGHDDTFRTEWGPAGRVV